MRVGSAPAGAQTAPSDIPILFNDHHVDAKPDRLKHDRVLAALVRGNIILVPLRSLFEQMGATVAYDPASKTVDVSKPGTDVQVTVGVPDVVINGERRPLDVPPEISKGTVVVPLRVISEGMGAFVQWIPERKTVVIRYRTAPTVAPTPAPAPPPTATPEPPSSPAPQTTPRPRRPRHAEHFVVGDYLFAPKVYNEFSPGNRGTGDSYAIHGAFEFRIKTVPLMLGADVRTYRYPHTAGTAVSGDPGFVTVIGGYGHTFVPAFIAQETDVEGRLGIKLLDPRIYFALGYLHREENYGYPKQTGVGVGLEKLPDLDRLFSFAGSVYYYPDVSGQFAFVNVDPYARAAGLSGTTQTLADRTLTYRAGFTLMLAGRPSEFGLFLEGGYLGDSVHRKSLSPSDAAHRGAYAGLGVKF